MTEIYDQEAQDLGIVPLHKRISATDCIAILQRRAMLPGFVLLVVIGGGSIALMFALGIADTRIDLLANSYQGIPKFVVYGLFVVSVLLLFSPAFLWWLYAAPRWRVWALQNCDDWPALQKATQEKFGSSWPRNSSWMRPEINSAFQKQLEQRLIEYRDKTSGVYS